MENRVKNTETKRGQKIPQNNVKNMKDSQKEKAE